MGKTTGKGSHRTSNLGCAHFYDFLKDIPLHPSLNTHPRNELTLHLALSTENLYSRFPFSLLHQSFLTIKLLAYHPHLTFLAVTDAGWEMYWILGVSMSRGPFQPKLMSETGHHPSQALRLELSVGRHVCRSACILRRPCRAVPAFFLEVRFVSKQRR